MAEKKNMGLGTFRNRENKTQRLQGNKPEYVSRSERTHPQENLLFHKETKKLKKPTTKTVKLTLDTHTAVTTIATIQNQTITDTLTDIVEAYIRTLPPQTRKLIRYNIESAKGDKFLK